MNIDFCPHCQKHLNTCGSPVSELYYTICDIVMCSNTPLTFFGSFSESTLLRFLELKGYITSLEEENNMISVRPNYRFHADGKPYLCATELHNICNMVDY